MESDDVEHDVTDNAAPSGVGDFVDEGADETEVFLSDQDMVEMYEDSEDTDEFFSRFANIGDAERQACVEEQFSRTAVSDVASLASQDCEYWQRTANSRTLESEAGLWAELFDADEVELLYEEALYSVNYAVGSDVSHSVDELYLYLQQVCNFSEEKHSEILARVNEKLAPRITLHIDISEGRNLAAKDANGLSDPFCIVYVSSNPGHQLNTTMKSSTVNPVWNEQLTFSVETAQEETLHIEVWDFDPDESVSDKVSRFGQVKGCKGFGKLLKEIATSSSSSGKTSHEFIGSFALPLKEIPMTGLNRWFRLEGRENSKNKTRGDLRIKAVLIPEQNRSSSQQNFAIYEKLLRIFVKYNIETNPEWRGALTSLEKTLLHQIGLHQNVRPSLAAIIYWCVLSSALHHRTVDLELMSSMLERSSKLLQDAELEQNLRQLFWESAEMFTKSALLMIRHIQNNDIIGSNPEQLRALLKNLEQLLDLDSRREESIFDDFKTQLTDTITMSCADWLSRAVGQRKIGGPISDDDRVENAVRICHSLMADLRRALTSHNEIFCTVLQVPYYSIIYNYYDSQLASLCRPVVEAVTRSLRSMDLTEDQLTSAAMEASGEVPDNSLKSSETVSDRPGSKKFNPKVTMGTALFELYMTLQQFHKLSSVLPESQLEQLKLNNYHNWFSAAVARWLDIALYKALIRIGKAASMDSFQPVDSLVKHSSSAVDALSVFYQIRTFWQQMSWPDAEGAVAFITKIIDDVCRSSMFYANVVHRKLEKLDCIIDGRFHVTQKVCCAVHDIVYLRNSIRSISESLGIAELYERLQQLHGDSFHNSSTIDTVIQNAEENIDAKLDDIYFFISRRIEKEVHSFFDVDWDTSVGVIRREELIRYLDENLITLHSQLEGAVFDQILKKICDHVMYGVISGIQMDVERKRLPTYYKHWDELLKILMNFFYGSPSETAIDGNDQIIARIRNLIRIHGSETSELIQQYYLSRMRLESDEIPKHGTLSVRALFVDDILTVEVINARNLTAMDASGTSDPYMKLSLMPSDKFPEQVRKTKTHKNTLFPVFDETFTFNVAKDHQLEPDCFLLFTLKDHDLIGADDFAAEAFLGFQSIPRGDSADDLKQMEQITLTFTRPTENGSEYLEALKKRTWDKAARDFVQNQKKLIPKAN